MDKLIFFHWKGMEDIHFQISIVVPETVTLSNVSLINDMTVPSILLIYLDDIAFICWDMLFCNIQRVLGTENWSIFGHA